MMARAPGQWRHGRAAAAVTIMAPPVTQGSAVAALRPQPARSASELGTRTARSPGARASRACEGRPVRIKLAVTVITVTVGRGVLVTILAIMASPSGGHRDSPGPGRLRRRLGPAPEAQA
jgi:hypothetical protein